MGEKLNKMKTAAKKTAPLKQTVAAGSVVTASIPSPCGDVEVVPATLFVVRKCGHESRVIDLQNSDCGACSRSKAKAEKDNQGVKGAIKAELNDEGRLPDGSVFNVIYDAATKRWEDVLLMLTDRLRFEASNGSVHRLLMDLGQQYFAAKKQANH